MFGFNIERDKKLHVLFRLSDNSVEPVSFTVPRVKSTFFQDDLFPPTRVLWRPTVTGNAWARGEVSQISHGG